MPLRIKEDFDIELTVPESEFLVTLRYGVIKQNTLNLLQNLEHLGLGITSALEMVENHCLGAKVRPNEDVFKKNLARTNLVNNVVGYYIRLYSTYHFQVFPKQKLGFFFFQL